MYPNLFEIGGVTITSFGVMMFLSFLTGAWVLARQLETRGLEGDIAWDALIWIAVGGIVGAKLYYNFLHFDALAADPLGELTNRAGLVWYGGLIGGVLAYYAYVRRHRLPTARMFDATAPALALAYAVGRVGCFLVGDDYGLPTEQPWGVAFPQGAPPSTAGYLRTVGAEIPASVPDSTVLAVHPTQLYEVALALVMFVILLKLSRRGLRPGQLFGAFLGMYGIERFFIEFVRAKGDRILFGLSTSQFMSLLLVGLAILLWTRARPEGSDRPGPGSVGKRTHAAAP